MNLIGADLSNAYLRHGALQGADLSGADLRYADLWIVDDQSNTQIILFKDIVPLITPLSTHNV